MSRTVTVASEEELPPGSSVVCTVDGAEVAVFNVDGEFYAVDNECPHMSGPIGEGFVDDGTVNCPWHGAEFDLETGEVCRPPASEPLSTYDVTVEDGTVLVEV